MDQTITEQNGNDLSQQAETARKLLDDARKATFPQTAQQEDPALRAIRTSTPTLTPDQRLTIINQIADSALANFPNWDVTDNRFLGRHELAAVGTAAGDYLHSKHDAITALYNDYTRIYRARSVDNNHLGLSAGDLRTLKAITSSSTSDLNAEISRRAWNSGYTAGFSATGLVLGLLGASGGLAAGSPKLALTCLGIGFGIGAAGYGLGYLTERGRLQQLRSDFGQDSSIDRFAPKLRFP